MKLRLIHGVFFAIVAAVMACSGCPAQKPQPVSPSDTLLWAPPDPAQCPYVCEHYRELGCPAGDSSPGSETPCYLVCANYIRVGGNWNMPCRLAAKSCEEADKCEGQVQ